MTKEDLEVITGEKKVSLYKEKIWKNLFLYYIFFFFLLVTFLRFSSLKRAADILWDSKLLGKRTSCSLIETYFVTVHRTTEALKLESISGDHLFQPPALARVWHSRGVPRQDVNTSKDGDSTISFGNLFQCLITLTGKKKSFLCLNGFSCILVCAYCFFMFLRSEITDFWQELHDFSEIAYIHAYTGLYLCKRRATENARTY